MTPPRFAGSREGRAPRPARLDDADLLASRDGPAAERLRRAELSGGARRAAAERLEALAVELRVSLIAALAVKLGERMPDDPGVRLPRARRVAEALAAPRGPAPGRALDLLALHMVTPAPPLLLLAAMELMPSVLDAARRAVARRDSAGAVPRPARRSTPGRAG